MMVATTRAKVLDVGVRYGEVVVSEQRQRVLQLDGNRDAQATAHGAERTDGKRGYNDLR
jgi:hypothetical protein